MEDVVEKLGFEESPEIEFTMKDDLCMEIDPPVKDAAENAGDWRKALKKVVPAVVVLRTTACRAFDTQSADASYATGFVVDKCRGIILTNRHVVKPGPVVAEAMFLNREEIPVHPVYRDPVHDFGFFHYDPQQVRFLSYEEIPLAPECACVGLEIRVIGNDSGEKVSILAGTLARLDRDAPNYKKDGYNDFNTFYMQAASGTKGGSSGSPVIDCQGRAVALNAGGKSSSASAFFLPLERVVRALRYLQNGRDLSPGKWPAVHIPRGTLQVTFVHKGFDETFRLGLKRETELMVRNASPPEETGMLIVESVVPGGPAYKQLETGDVLVFVNGEVMTQFLKLETLLDDCVNQKFEMQIERGGTPVTVELVVQDTHSVTPDYFLEVSGAVIHPLSYQQARNFRFNCGLVYVADPGYILSKAGVPRHAILKKVSGQEISCLDELISVLSKLSRGIRVPLEYITHVDRYRRKSVLVTVDRHEWYASPCIYTRDDSCGLWIPRPALPSDSPLLSPGINYVHGGSSKEACLMDFSHEDNHQKLPAAAASMETNSDHASEEAKSQDEHNTWIKKNNIIECLSDDAAITPSLVDESVDETIEDLEILENDIPRDYQGARAAASISFAVERSIEPTLVMFEVHVPTSCMLDGVRSVRSSGTGVIIHHSQSMGLVVVDKNTVSITSSDIMLSFAAYPIEIPGEVIFLHPVHNYALIAYDPSALGVAGAAVVRAAELLPVPRLRRGDAVYLVGLSRSLQATSRKSIVTNPGAALNIGSAANPRYRAINMEVIELDTDFGSTFSGVLTNEHGRVQALWGSFSTQIIIGSNSLQDHQFVRGIPIDTISQVLDKILSGANGPHLLINGIKRAMPFVRILEGELYPTLLSKARSFGLGDDWIKALVKKDPLRRQVLRVKGCLAGSRAEKVLEQGDMLLAINKEPVTCFRDIENACLDLDKDDYTDGMLQMTIFRQGCEMEVVVGTDVRDGIGTVRVVSWCGCIVQDPHPAVRALGFLPEEGHGVFVARWNRGSPAHRYGLYALLWIIEVNGKPTPDLDAFVSVTKELEHGEYARVRTVHLNGKPRVLTLKQDLHYWPTWELRFDIDTALWRRNTIKALDSAAV
ncbi:hypothetical protein RND81_08G225800 [Saponaria officinalis]|uniref:PDZ domain-containing protein n=1 Tax=Saponaria officinalis TaxID=3572 RepID=A0AAW1JBG5_SAPOF